MKGCAAKRAFAVCIGWISKELEGRQDGTGLPMDKRIALGLDGYMATLHDL